LVAQQEVTVAGADVTGLSVAIHGTGTVTGVIEDDSGAVLPSNLVVFVELIGAGNRPGPPMPVRVRPDGSFSFSGIQSGDVYLSVALAPDSKYSVKFVTVNGTDPRRTPLKVIEGAEAGPVHVVISSAVGTLVGRVLSDRTGQVLSDYIVLLAPIEPERRRFRTGHLTTRSSPDGTFAVSGTPGEYFVFVRRREELPPIVTEEFFRSASVNAQRVVLRSNEQTRSDFRVP
jgi:hypothetical protein